VIVLASHKRRASHGLHPCAWCLQRIALGEWYIDLRVASDGTCWTQRQHIACLDLVNRYCAYHAVDEEDHIDWPEVLAWAAEQEATP
jgi:hypothetical protein